MTVTSAGVSVSQNPVPGDHWAPPAVSMNITVPVSLHLTLIPEAGMYHSESYDHVGEYSPPSPVPWFPPGSALDLYRDTKSTGAFAGVALQYSFRPQSVFSPIAEGSAQVGVQSSKSALYSTDSCRSGSCNIDTLPPYSSSSAVNGFVSIAAEAGAQAKINLTEHLRFVVKGTGGFSLTESANGFAAAPAGKLSLNYLF